MLHRRQHTNEETYTISEPGRIINNPAFPETCDEMMPQLTGQLITLIHILTAPPASPQSIRAMHVSGWIPRSTHCFFV